MAKEHIAEHEVTSQLNEGHGGGFMSGFPHTADHEAKGNRPQYSEIDRPAGPQPFEKLRGGTKE